MGKSYRIKATPGKDQNVVLQVDQDFEQLEILSLKIRQSEIYLRMCSETGIVAGRVFANNGYGIPNAKLSIFIPVTDEDAKNPTIEAVYPYKNLEQLNEDGYRYNLLPYLPSYEGHTPTGTFPSRSDNLVNQTVVQLYDKYYKYTVQTNDSGDYMIYGVPLGSQTLVMNVDLSDIGPFSLTPQDLVRMGLATEDQIDGEKFKSSTNLSELPQIIILNKTIEVLPFYGEDEVCQIGITRMDFDLTTEANVNLQPTAVFMGSLMSGSERTAIKPSGRARKVTGQLCKMIAGPGEIIALRQTIFLDTNGLPIIERAKLENGGKVIDDNGAWLTEIPMNLDYVFTDEYGNQVFSNDPKIGVPTKAKYRFKIKWQQSNRLSEDYKRGYWLVPNIREKGWDNGNIDPADINNSTTLQYLKFQSSYAFSYDWSAYTWNTANISSTNQDILDAINCVDTFYEFYYNKVYTVSMFMDNYRHADNRQRFLAIKNIDDDGCDDTVNRYPVNDAYFNAGILWRVLNILIIILSYVLFPLLLIYHIIALLWNDLWLLLCAALVALGGLGGLIIVFALVALRTSVGRLKGFSLPMITYPDCDACDCGANTGFENNNANVYSTGATSTCKCATLNVTFGGKRAIGYFSWLDCNGNRVNRTFGPSKSTTLRCVKLGNTLGENVTFTSLGVRTPVYAIDYCCDPVTTTSTSTGATNVTYPINIQTNIGEQIINLHEYQTFQQGGLFSSIDIQNAKILAGYDNFSSPSYGLPISNVPTNINSEPDYYSEDLPFGERINLFNLKSKYYDNVNQVSVQYEPTLNGANFHLDNVLIMIRKSDVNTSNYSPGTVFTFVDIDSSMDINVTNGPTNIFGTNNISGNTNYPTSVSLNFADPNNRIGNLTQTYNLPSVAQPQESLYIYPSDIEYYQIVDSLTISDFLSLCSNSPITETFADILKSSARIVRTGLFASVTDVDIVDTIDQDSIIVICQRGVDPYSPTYTTKVGLGKIFGFTNYSDYEVTVPLRLNIPIQSSNDPQNLLCFKHDSAVDNQTPQYGLNLFYPSYCFTPNLSEYVPYNTTMLNYYSSLDYDLNYQIDPTTNFLQDALITNRGPYNSSLEVWATTSNKFYNATANPEKYKDYESLVGGSYMYFNQVLGIGGYFKAYYYSKIYPMTNNINMTSGLNIIVRSDRLPSGNIFDATSGVDRVLLLQQNNELVIYNQKFNYQTYNTATGNNFGNISTGVPQENQDDGDTLYSSILSSFDCENMTQLQCYSGGGFNLYIDNACSADTENRNHVQNGCYKFMIHDKFEPWNGTGPVIDFFRWDVKNYWEYFYRLRINFALCQEIFGTMFHNNWINGNLFAFPFKINTYYDSNNQVDRREYPRDVVVLHDETNNFYYRSSPYNSTNAKFVGTRYSTGYKGANQRNLRFPTTIMDLGPKYKFLNQLVFNNNFDGYNMKKLSPTSYNDLSDLINLFVFSRTFQPDWLAVAFGVGKGSFTNFYSRPTATPGLKYFIDGDAAQAMAINSQIGVIPFDDSYYTSIPTPGIPSVIMYGVNPQDIVMGIFFTSSTEDIQIRDYVSPMRTIIGQNTSGTWLYKYIANTSQEVPNYRWEIKPSNVIFGTQLNDWNYNLSNNSFYYKKYQELIRKDDYLSATVVPANNEIGYMGYLSNESNVPFVNQSPLIHNPGLVGAPWYFYFGLMKGKTAINLFYTKYIGETTLNEQ